MNVEQWFYYEHALLPKTAPHEDAHFLDIMNTWSKKNWGGVPLIARWTTDFDCKKETEWWYVIKDDEFDIQALKSKRRYEILRGDKMFDSKTFCAFDYREEYYQVDIEAYKDYPEKYRPIVNKELLFRSLKKNKSEPNKVFYGAFLKETNELCGYLLINVFDSHIVLAKQKVKPQYEKNGINAFLVHSVLIDYKDRLGHGFYICDGERSIVHETRFQDYLEKYFGFRKAYCKLNICVNPTIRPFVNIIYMCRKVLFRLDSIGVVHKVNGIMKMVEISKS